MNRPIKFRVWDHILSEWIKSDQLVLRPNGSVTDGSILIDSKYIQFNTGLTDNNDDPIYEGNILKNHYDVSNNIIGQVLYESDYGGYIFQWKRRGQDYKITNLNCDVAFHSAIVGNIFEHSELLK
jgi:uncharacterized phage protein (TIGR01671 family)